MIFSIFKMTKTLITDWIRAKSNRKRAFELKRFHEEWEKGDFDNCLWHINKYIDSHPKDEEKLL